MEYDSNAIIKFADDMTMVGLITNDHNTAYREKVNDLAVWCQDYKKRRAKHITIHIDGAVEERFEGFKFLGVHIAKELTWSTHTNTVVKKARQRLFPLRRLKRFDMDPQTVLQLQQ
jgi:hypothetical protein